MSDVDPQLEDPDETETIQQLRDRVRRAEKAEGKSKVIEKENAFLKAGITNYEGDQSNPVAALFFNTYQGELTRDAIRTDAAKLGLLDAGEVVDPNDTVATPEEQAAHAGRLILPGDSVDPDLSEPKPTIKDAYAERGRLLETGRDHTQASVAVFGHMMSQAAEGNPDYVFDVDRYHQEGGQRGDYDDLLGQHTR